MQLYEPIDVLKPFGKEIWIVDGPLVHMAVGRLKVPFTTRMTVIRLDNGDLILHSPTKYSAELAAKVTALGPVRHLISPNKIHYEHIESWRQAFPGAEAWASPGVKKRAAQQNIAVKFDHELATSTDTPWQKNVAHLVFRGSRVIDEIVFFHRPSRTLVLADLIENFEREFLPWYMRGVARLGGVLHPDGQTPLDFRLTFWQGRDQARASFKEILAWKPEKIVVAHGRCYDSNGESELKRSFRWLS